MHLTLPQMLTETVCKSMLHSRHNEMTTCWRFLIKWKAFYLDQLSARMYYSSEMSSCLLFRPSGLRFKLAFLLSGANV